MKNALGLALLATAATAGGVPAQGLGVGARAGTLGIGAEVGVGLGERVVLRGGVGLTPVEPSTTLGDIDVTLELPTWYNVGVDVYLNGALRLGTGLLIKSDDPTLSAVFTTDQEIGGQTFTPQEIGTLVGVIDSRDPVPYALIGFGKHTSPGVGLFVDLGVGFLGEPDFQLSSEGGSQSQSAQLRQELDREEAEFEEDAGGYLKLWPILSLGLRIGVD